MFRTAQHSYFRPIPCAATRPGAQPLAGGLYGFVEVEVLTRGQPARILPAAAVAALEPGAAEAMAAITAPRAPVLGLDLASPKVMGVLNVTPDSFSDGGRLANAAQAVATGLALVTAGADCLDIGGESTRPGAEPVSEAEELQRVIPVIEGLIRAGCSVPLSIDTRNAAVARAALAAGAVLFNDVSALGHDPDSAGVAAMAGAVCLSHAPLDPRVMHLDPRYDDVLLEVYDYLAERIALAESAGVPRARILVDPGIGFAKTMAHNLVLIRRLGVLHALGCGILLGVSRKRFIGVLGAEPRADRRGPGSIAAGLVGLGEGAQILRVHDVAETAQAVAVWRALQTDRQ